MRGTFLFRFWPGLRFHRWKRVTRAQRDILVLLTAAAINDANPAELVQTNNSKHLNPDHVTPPPPS